MSPHRCHARGCAVEVAPWQLFCLKHWRLTPRPLQARVWAEYREGQEVDKQPSAAYVRAAQAAVRAVAEREREERR